MTSEKNIKKITIVGGGLAGVCCALTLAKKKLPNTKIVLISNSPHLEYHAALYRVVAGHSPLEVCIPLSEIFRKTEVEVVEDKILSIDPEKKRLVGSSESEYSYHSLVLTLGSETVYFDIPNLEKSSFTLKNTQGALRLKRHLHETFNACVVNKDAADKRLCQTHFVIVGGGPAGVELAGELAIYARQVAEQHGLDPSFVTLDLVHSKSRLVDFFPKKVSVEVEKRVRMLGVNLFLNRRLQKKEVEEVILTGMSIDAKTLIWAAGVRANHLYSKIKGLQLNDRGRVKVTTHLRAKGMKDIYIAGDGADVLYSGMAVSAMQQGQYVAQEISSRFSSRSLKPFTPKPPLSAMPVGPGWAVVVGQNWQVYGRFGWWLRRWIDLKVFLTILPIGKAWTAFRDGMTLTETCPVCRDD